MTAATPGRKRFFRIMWLNQNRPLYSVKSRISLSRRAKEWQSDIKIWLGKSIKSWKIKQGEKVWNSTRPTETNFRDIRSWLIYKSEDFLHGFCANGRRIDLKYLSRKLVESELSISWINTNQVVLNNIVRKRDKIPVFTIPTFDFGFLANRPDPLISTDRLVSSFSGALAFRMAAICRRGNSLPKHLPSTARLLDVFIEEV